MIQVVKQSLGSALDKTGLLDLMVRFAQARAENCLTVLMYHRVIDRQDPLFVGIPLEQFAQQMAYISEYWNPVSEAQIVAFYRDDTPLPRGAVFVTFDDGYVDAYTLALPILKRYKIPAVLFVSSDPVEKNDLLWTDELSLMLKYTTLGSLKVELFGETMSFDLNTPEEKGIALFAIKKPLKQVSDERRHEALRVLRDHLGALTKEQRAGYLVTQEHMRELHESGVAIAAHTVTHPILSQVNEARSREEIYGSRDYLLQRGYPQLSFCYPNGQRADYNDVTLRQVREAGYEIAFTTEEGCNNSKTNPFELLRLHVSNLPMHVLKFRFAKHLLKAGA